MDLTWNLGGMMRSIVAFTTWAVLLATATGCSSLDVAYIREGIGSNLYSSELPDVSYLQDVYVGGICRQAGLRVSQQGDVLLCDDFDMRPGEWATFVQAGMNDIDRRCDAYLTWLDNKRRSREPILKQVNTTAATTAVILGLTGVGVTPIAIVAEAFSFAQDSFTNFQSRLITEIDHAVIQSVVLDHQNQFRDKIAKVPVDSRPEAIYLLRNYLRICMPTFIEMSISNTITTFHRNGADALRVTPLLTRAPGVAARVAAAAPPAAREAIRPPVRVALTTLEDYRQIIADYDPKVHTISKVEPALIKLCVPPAELRAIGERTKLLIRIYQLAAGLNVTGQLRTRDILRLNDINDCPADRFNYFEAQMRGGLNAPENIALFNSKLASDRQLRTGATVAEVRSRIPELRASMASRLKLQSPLLANQITSDLMGELSRPQ
jgi:hypothetical protein